MSDNNYSPNPSEYEGRLIEKNILLQKLVKELLTIINRNGIEMDNEYEVMNLLIKIEIFSQP